MGAKNSEGQRDRTRECAQPEDAENDNNVLIHVVHGTYTEEEEERCGRNGYCESSSEDLSESLAVAYATNYRRAFRTVQ